MAGDRTRIPVTATIAVVCAPALSSFAATGLLPVLPQMVKAFGGNTAIVTLTITLPMLTAALVTALLGVVGDRISRSALFIVSAGLFACAAPLPFAIGALPVLFAARFVTGLAIGGMVASSLGLIGDLYTSDRRALLLSAQTTIAAATSVGGVALNGLLGQHGWQYAFLIYLIGVPFFLMAFTLPSASQPKATIGASPVATRFPWRATAPVYALTVFGVLLIVPPTYELGYFLTERGIGSSIMIGNMTAGAMLGTALGALLLPRIKTMPALVTAAMSMLLSSLGQWLIYGAGVAIAPLVIGVLLFGSAQGLFMTLMAFWLLGSIDGSARGRATGLYRALLYASGFTAPLIARALSHALGGSQRTVLAYATLTLVLTTALALAHVSGAGKPAATA